MVDQILNTVVFKTPLGVLDHYEVSFQIDPASFPCGFTVTAAEMTDPTDMAELKAKAIVKAQVQKAIEMLVRTDDASINGPVSL
jgi:hypothetical protein